MLNTTNGPVFDANGREIAPGAAIVHRAPAEAIAQPPAPDFTRPPETMEEARAMAIAEIQASDNVASLRLALKYSENLFIIVAAYDRLKQLGEDVEPRLLLIEPYEAEEMNDDQRAGLIVTEPFARVTDLAGNPLTPGPDGLIHGDPLDLTAEQRASLPPLDPNADPNAQPVVVTSQIESNLSPEEQARFDEMAANNTAALEAMQARDAKVKELADGKATDAIAEVKASADVLLLQQLAAVDTRTTVKEAIEHRLAELSKPDEA